MTITLDDITRKKLILVRQIFQRAILQQGNRYSYVDRIMALIGFDLCNETILKAVIGSVSPKDSIKTDFQSIVNQAESILLANQLSNIPDKPKIQHVRALRNDAQHKAKYPNENDVSDCRTYTQDFLRQITQNVWGLDFETISLVDLIQNIEVKKLLMSASEKLTKQDYTDSAFDSKAAFQAMISSVKNPIMGVINTRVLSQNSSEFTEIIKIQEEIDELRNLLMYSIMGLDLRNFKNYKEITNTTFIGYLGGGKYQGAIGRAPYTQIEADFVFNFVVNSIIQIESFVENST